MALDKLTVNGDRFYAGGKEFIPWGANYLGDYYSPSLNVTEDINSCLEWYKGLDAIKANGANIVRIIIQVFPFMTSISSADINQIYLLQYLLALIQIKDIYVDITGLGIERYTDVPSWYINATEADRWTCHQTFWEEVAKIGRQFSNVAWYSIMNEPGGPPETTLTSGINSSSTSPIPVISTSGFGNLSSSGSGGTILIDNEVISFTSMTSNTFAGTITRGANGTTAASHSNSAYVNPGYIGNGSSGNSEFVQLFTRALKGRNYIQLGQTWTQQIVSAIKAIDTNTLVTISGLPSGNYTTYPWHSENMKNILDFHQVHLYPQTGNLTNNINLATDWVNRGGGKPVVIEECYPLNCTTEEINYFYSATRKMIAGYLGHLNGKTASDIDTLSPSDTFAQVPIIDDLNRSNQNPIASDGINNSWLGPITSGQNELKLLNSQLAGTASGTNDSYWNYIGGSFFVLDSLVDGEAWCDIAVQDKAIRIYMRIANPGSGTLNAYWVEANKTAQTLKLGKTVSGSETVLVSTGYTDADDGHAIGIRCIGTTIQGFIRKGTFKNPHIFSKFGESTDNSITAAGKSGIRIQDTTARVDNFAFYYTPNFGQAIQSNWIKASLTPGSYFIPSIPPIRRLWVTQELARSGWGFTGSSSSVDTFLSQPYIKELQQSFPNYMWSASINHYVRMQYGPYKLQPNEIIENINIWTKFSIPHLTIKNSPNSDQSMQWSLTGGATASAILNKSTLQPNIPSLASYVSTNGNALKLETKTVSNMTIPSGKTIEQIIVYYYADLPANTSHTVGIIDRSYGGSTGLAFSTKNPSAAGWNTVTYTGNLTQTQLNNLYIQWTSYATGTPSPQKIYSAYIEVILEDTGTPAANVKINNSSYTKIYASTDVKENFEGWHLTTVPVTDWTQTDLDNLSTTITVKSDYFATGPVKLYAQYAEATIKQLPEISEPTEYSPGNITEIPVPRGLENTININGLILNDRKSSYFDTYKLTQIDGLDDPEIRDTREPRQQGHGEIPFEAFYSGRTLTLQGIIRAGNIDRLRQLQSNLKGALNNLEETNIKFKYYDVEEDFTRVNNVNQIFLESLSSSFVIKNDTLAPSYPLVPTRLSRSYEQKTYIDSRQILEFRTGATLVNNKIALFARHDGKGNLLKGEILGDSIINYVEVTDNTEKILSTTPISPVLSPNTTYWLTLLVIDKKVQIKIWNYDPTNITYDSLPSFNLSTETSLFSPFSAGQNGSVGIEATAADTTFYINKYKINGIVPSDIEISARKIAPLQMIEQQINKNIEREFNISLRASDPRLTGPVLIQLETLPSFAVTYGHTYTKTFPYLYKQSIKANGDVYSQQPSLTITNKGNFAADVILEVFGTVKNPIITNITTGKTMKFVGGTLYNGDKIILDSKAKTATFSNGENAYAALDITSEWITLAPGNNQIFFQAETFDSNAKLRISWRNTWL